ncbi:hypothetical protein K7432_008223 [Basidiobolus ranarum]|uniref:Uncharacterized protein n=1 Tax=Basidiobolus ranarum TaxID=34480 RepID=A0ABR2VYX6_9FUNG
MRLPSVAEAGVKCFIFCVSAIIVEASSNLGIDGTNLKRDVTSLTEQCGPDIYCLPKFNTTWTMGSVGLLRWNSNYPTFKVQGHVDIRLYEMTNPRKPVKEWLDITNDEGLWSVKLDHASGIFPEYFKRPKNTTVVRNYRFLVTVKDDALEGRQKGPIFNIEGEFNFLPYWGN